MNRAQRRSFQRRRPRGKTGISHPRTPYEVAFKRAFGRSQQRHAVGRIALSIQRRVEAGTLTLPEYRHPQARRRAREARLATV